MTNEPFLEGEIFHRVVKPNYNWWVSKENRLSSAAFKDSHGLSVDRAANRSSEEVTNFLKQHLPDGCAEIIISLAVCSSTQSRIVSEPTLTNPFHMLILGEFKTELPNRAAKYFAEHCSHKLWDHPVQ